MKTPFIGREKEQQTLQKALASYEAEMVAVIGRRRIGKTFLIRNAYEGQIDLEVTGTQNTTGKEQLENFTFLVNNYLASDKPISTPKTWLEAFRELIVVLERRGSSSRKTILFFDELPWLASKKSGFLKALGFFWNNWASKQPILVVICGSAASWMIQKVVNNKGGLHNRITRLIHLKAFNLPETEAYFKARHIRLERYELLNIYMIMGGVPHYLKEIEPGKSAVQNIDEICFSQHGILNNEFSRLYEALFDQADNHIAIVRALATKWKGLTRKEIVSMANLPEGGGVSKVLDELINSGFISSYYPFGKTKKDMLYRLTDEYSLFFLHFIENKRSREKRIWQKLSQTQTYKSWRGYAFESLCLKHIEQIKRALQIGGIYSEASSFVFRGDDTRPGIQIDLLIDRNDHAINLCEMKFYNDVFTIDKAYAENLRRKRAIFQEVTQTRKQVFITLITSFGLIPNQHSIGLIDQDFNMDILFEEEFT
ncbi:MAG: ATP-binding protein [Bacteroidia bacterium]